MLRHSLLPALLALMSVACTNVEPDVDIEAVLQHNPYGAGKAAQEQQNYPPPHRVEQSAKPASVPSAAYRYRAPEKQAWREGGRSKAGEIVAPVKKNLIVQPSHPQAGQVPKTINHGPSTNGAAKELARKMLPEKSEQAQKIKNASQKKLILSNDNRIVLKFYCQWPIEGKVVRSFSRTGNKGVDIGARYGQPVKAAAAGKVVYSGHGLRGYGNLLIIEHQGGFLSAYGNNSKLLVDKGQQVEAGRAVAEAGKGAGHEAVLHFEIRKNGKPVNPMECLPR